MNIPTNIFLISTAFIHLVACGDGKDTAESTNQADNTSTTQDDGDAAVNDFVLRMCEIEHQDPYTLGEISFDGSTMNIGVSYSGGCGSHEWQLCWDGGVAESFPVQISLALGHNANGDTCEMEKAEVLSFDISILDDVEQPTQVHIGGTSVYRGDWPED